MSFVFSERLRLAFAPPSYLVPPLSGIDISTSGVKIVRLAVHPRGLMLDRYAQIPLPAGAFLDGDVLDHSVVATAIAKAARTVGVSSTNVALSESKSYLFEATVAGSTKTEWYTAIEQQLDEFIPLSAAEAAFDIVPTAPGANGETHVAGIGFARRIVDETLTVFDQAGVTPRSLESEVFASARALLPLGDQSTTLIIDIGRTTTKVTVVGKCIPLFATTIGIGGHALTLAVQKHFGVTEEEARKVKMEHGILIAPENEDYIETMLSTLSAIREEIQTRLEYWQTKIAAAGTHEPVSQVLLVGGNASVRGLPEYLEGTLRIPVSTGDVFKNFISRDEWLPTLDYTESLVYATAIGLALRDYTLYV
jgi:type IV pilus assembly protein PilM